MSTLDDWSNQEIVRAIKTLTSAVERLESSLDSKFVSREVYHAERAADRAALDRLGAEVAQNTSEREAAQSGVRYNLLFPVIVGIALLLSNWLIFRGH